MINFIVRVMFLVYILVQVVPVLIFDMKRQMIRLAALLLALADVDLGEMKK